MVISDTWRRAEFMDPYFEEGPEYCFIECLFKGSGSNSLMIDTRGSIMFDRCAFVNVVGYELYFWIQGDDNVYMRKCLFERCRDSIAVYGGHLYMNFSNTLNDWIDSVCLWLNSDFNSTSNNQSCIKSRFLALEMSNLQVMCSYDCYYLKNNEEYCFECKLIKYGQFEYCSYANCSTGTALYGGLIKSRIRFDGCCFFNIQAQFIIYSNQAFILEIVFCYIENTAVCNFEPSLLTTLSQCEHCLATLKPYPNLTFTNIIVEKEILRMIEGNKNYW